MSTIPPLARVTEVLYTIYKGGYTPDIMNNQPKNELTPADGGQNTPAPSASGPTNDHAANVVRGQIDQIYNKDQPTTQENPYNRTHQENFDWTKYHSAWQEYYQEYYRRHYEQSQPPTEAPAVITGGDEPPKTRVQALKADIRNKVTQQAKGFRKSHHFMPVVSALVVGLLFLLLQFNSIFIAQVKAYISPGALEGQSVVVTDPLTSLTVGPEPRLIIPKINVDVPVDYTVTALDDPTVQVALKGGAVHYKVPAADSLPGQYGNSVFLGHSSNDVFAGGDYKFAFVLTDRLEPGDTFYLHYNSIRYTYKVTEKKVINPDEISALQIGNAKPMVTLVTCTPPGTALKRLLIYAEQVSPDPASATQPPAPTPATQSDDLPGNAPTLFEQIIDIFF